MKRQNDTLAASSPLSEAAFTPPAHSNTGKLISYHQEMLSALKTARAIFDISSVKGTKVENYIAISFDESLYSSIKRIEHIIPLIAKYELKPKLSEMESIYVFDMITQIRSVNDKIVFLYILLSENDLIYEKYPGGWRKMLDIMTPLTGYEAAIPLITEYVLSSNRNRKKIDFKLIDNQISNLIKVNFVGKDSFFADYKKEEGNVQNLKKKNPVHPGVLIGNHLSDLDWSVAYAAEHIGVTREQLHRVIRGGSRLSPEMAKGLARNKIGGTAFEWSVLQVQYDLAQPDRPKTKRARAGNRLEN